MAKAGFDSIRSKGAGTAIVPSPLILIFLLLATPSVIQAFELRLCPGWFSCMHHWQDRLAIQYG